MKNNKTKTNKDVVINAVSASGVTGFVKGIQGIGAGISAIEARRSQDKEDKLYAMPKVQHAQSYHDPSTGYIERQTVTFSGDFLSWLNEYRSL